MKEYFFPSFAVVLKLELSSEAKLQDPQIFFAFVHALGPTKETCQVVLQDAGLPAQ